MTRGYMECPTCAGEGQVEVDMSRGCRVVMSECCGGCVRHEPCETCAGSGYVEEEPPDGIDYEGIAERRHRAERDYASWRDK